MFPNTQELDTLSPIGQSPKGYHMAEWETIKTYPLARELESKADPKQLASVIGLIDHAAPLLDRIIETFPTYTLHDRTHSRHVLRLMGRLLGPRCSSLTALEAAMLILAAYFHDIGMVFNKDQRQSLKDEPEFPQFLHQHPEARLAVTRNHDQIPEEIAVWYCRHRHADRVTLFLNELDKDNRLNWGRVSLKDALALVCRSHNFDARELTASSFDTSYLAQCDLRFCSILLRLADILDFDHTRAPEPVYKHLGLPTPQPGPEKTSADEWRKHFSSDGFKFPPGPPIPYVLPFVAGPDDPNIEHDIRQFLDDIETEIATCHRLLEQCSQRWQDLLLPARIDRQIVSKGYTFGEFRFTLDQQQILDLFTGENLYRDPYVFIRELLQNAIDTSRFREYFEHAQGRKDFKASPIVVTGFTDAEGYSWVRFDDFGMGMDQRIIENYLLRVGKSYYESPEFQADKINCQAATARDFTPISRFGIGLLSCFLAGDRIEINTLHLADSGQAKPIRLSIPALTGYFVLQTPDNDPAPMPSETGPAPGYRRHPGTSIAVRFDPTKEAEPFNLQAQLETYLLCPPVPVLFQSEPIGGEPAELLDKPWCEPISIQLSDAEKQQLTQVFGLTLEHPVEIALVSIDLTACSPSADLKGQIILPLAKNPELERALRRRSVQGRVEHRDLIFRLLDPRALIVTAEYREYPDGASHPANPHRRCELDITRILGSLSDRALRTLSRAAPRISASHNGIRLPDFIGPDLWKYCDSLDYWVRGVIALPDSLRPDVSLARDRVRRIPWSLCSLIGLTLQRASRNAGVSPQELAPLFLSREFFDTPSVKALLDDPLLTRSDGWVLEPMIPCGPDARDRISVVAIRQARMPFPIPLLRIHIPAGAEFENQCSAALIQLHLTSRLNAHSDGSPFLEIVSPEPPALSPGEELFPALFFVPYAHSKAMRARYYTPLNKDHPFCRWLIGVAPELADKRPALLAHIRRRAIWPRASQPCDPINTLLDALRHGPHPIPVPDSVFLKAEDFGC